MKKIISMGILLFLLLTSQVDASDGGTISMRLPTGSNIELEVYFVASVSSPNLSEYTLTAGFESSGVNLNINTTDENLIQAGLLLNYAKNNSITPLKIRHTNSGNPMIFSGLNPGVYLFVQSSAEEQSHIVLGPFLIRTLHDGIWTIDSDLAAKTEPIPTPTPTPTPTPSPSPTPGSVHIPGHRLPNGGRYTPHTTEGDNPDDPFDVIIPPGSGSPPNGGYKTPITEVNTPSEPFEPITPRLSPTPHPGKPDLPQTGLLRWPIPILSGLGLLIVVTGVYMIRKGKK